MHHDGKAEKKSSRAKRIARFIYVVVVLLLTIGTILYGNRETLGRLNKEFRDYLVYGQQSVDPGDRDLIGDATYFCFAVLFAPFSVLVGSIIAHFWPGGGRLLRNPTTLLGLFAQFAWLIILSVFMFVCYLVGVGLLYVVVLYLSLYLLSLVFGAALGLVSWLGVTTAAAIEIVLHANHLFEGAKEARESYKDIRSR
jgi:hypothetical protein